MADDRLLLATLPLVAATMVRKRIEHRPNPTEQWWNDFRAAAPAPVWQYVMDLDPEVAVDPGYWLDPDEWLAARHPAFMGVVEAAHDAFHGELEAPLRHVQGELIKWAEWRLGWALAHERAAGVTAAVYDEFIGEQAAQSLLRWTHRESNTGWLTPELFLDRWRVAGTDDPQTLERAGLHSAELALLEADEGDSR